jgi:membrane protease YdiL (CAAX protease family)
MSGIFAGTSRGKVMTKFMAWLADEAKGRTYFWYIIFTGLIVISVDWSVTAAAENWFPTPRDPNTPYTPPTNPLEYWNALLYFSAFVLGPIKEEILFRILPLCIVIEFVSKTPRYVFGAAVAFAILFGAIHPYSIVGNIQVAVAGFFFGLCFLKCGGMNSSFVKASVAAIAAHGISNVLITLDAYYQYLEKVL